MVRESQYIIYREEQKFDQWWIRAIVIIVVLSTWFGFVQQIIIGKPFGPNPASNPAVILITILIGVGFPVLMFSVKMVTEIDTSQIYIKYIPFFRKTIRLDETAHYEIRKYRPIWEYGGWGIRWGGIKQGWVYNMSGNMGVQLTLKNGKRILIGTNQPEILKEAIDKAKMLRDRGNEKKKDVHKGRF